LAKVKTVINAVILLFLFLAQGSFGAVRVTLMDFAVDDNSYLSAQTASSFTSLLQNEFSQEPEIEWVERSQLDLARRELELHDLELLGGSSEIRLGNWLKADWMVNGKFSLDDQKHRTLTIEITDLGHADVLASQTLAFPGEATSPMKLEQIQTKFAAPTLKQLFLKARQRAEQTRRQTIIAPLFFFDARLPLYGRSDEFEPLRNAFYERVEKLEAAHSSVRIIRFPKAHSAMDESAMVLDGLVESGSSSWGDLADLYLWGIYSNVFIATPSRTNATKFLREKHHHLSLHVWDGVSAPFTYESQYRKPELERLTVSDSQDFWDRLEKEIVSRTVKGKNTENQSDARRQAARSILKLFTPANSRVYEQTKFIENVRLIEAACFLDPNNAQAQFMRINWRWGTWLDYRPAVKNLFWSKWRRSRAWGNYIERFGFENPTIKNGLYDRTEIPRLYVSSLESVLRAFPQQLEGNSIAWAQKDGFPKDVPPDRIAEWKAQVAAELAERTTKAQAYIDKIGEKYVFRSVVPPTNGPAKFQTTAFPPATNMPPVTTLPRLATTNRPTLTARTIPNIPLPAAPPPAVSQSRSKVDFKVPWMPKAEDISLFRLRAPSLWPVEVNPAITQITFPAHFDTKTIVKIVPWREQLVVLVVDERSRHSDELNADVSEELLTRAGRLWLVKEGSPPKLLAASGMPETIHAFLIENDHLWVAGQDFGYLDLNQQEFHICQKAEGSAAPDDQAIALSNGVLYTLQHLGVASLDPITMKWRELPRDHGRSPYGPSAGIQSILAANQRWLFYCANFPSFYNFSRQEWTNALNLNGTTCACAEQSGFWLGGENGLQFYDPDRASLESWRPPAVFNGLRIVTRPLDLKTLARDPGHIATSGDGFPDTPEVFRPSTDDANKTIKFMPPRREPLRLNSRIPARVAALLTDGNHLWMAISDRLVLLDLPSRSLVASCHFGGPVACVGILGEDVWVGLSYGQQLLSRVSKAEFFNVPKNAWKSLSISDEERTQVIQQMNLHDRVMYEFYAGDISGVAKALEGLAPRGTNLDVMLLAAFANGPAGVDNPPLARAWCQQILAHQPADSTWAKFAQKELNDGEQNHKTRQYQDRLLTKFDRNGDGVLDEDEKKAMQTSSEFQRATQAYQDDVLMPQIEALIRKYDHNKDGKLSSRELEAVRSAVKFLVDNSSERLDRYKDILAPVLTKAFPPVEKLLKQYDANKDGALDASELKAFAEDLRR
jgi:Ca2+-binding EF-hand superfamily protein